MHPLKELHVAVKRAQHFVGKAGVKYDGPFTTTGRVGLAIPVRNLAWLLDLAHDDETLQEHHTANLECLMFAARCINRYIDNHLIEGNDDEAWALASFLSRYDWGDLSSLIKDL